MRNMGNSEYGVSIKIPWCYTAFLRITHGSYYSIILTRSDICAQSFSEVGRGFQADYFPPSSSYLYFEADLCLYIPVRRQNGNHMYLVAL